MTETELIYALQQKQPHAFKLFVNTYKDRLYNTVLGFVQNATDAEDILQEVFIKAHDNIHRFQLQSALGTWMYRIAVTQSLDFLRRRKRAAQFAKWFGLHHQRETGSNYDHPGVLAEHKENTAQVFKAIEALPKNQKTAFVLQKIEGLSQKEIAAIMEVGEGAVESLLSRAKSNLKKLLQSYYS